MTLAHNPFAGETPFPQAGDGVLIKFMASDIAALHSLYGPDLRKSPEVMENGKVANTFWTTIIGWISVHDPVVIQNVLRVGLKERNGEGKLKHITRDKEWWDDPPFSYSDVAEAVEHGLVWSRWGVTPEQLAAQLETEARRLAELQAQGEEPDPQNRTMGGPTSSGSSNGHTKRASRPRKRGR